MRRETKIILNDKEVTVRELAIEDILGMWDKINSLEKGQTLLQEAQKLALFASEILPKITDLDKKILLVQGFSAIRKLWNAFLEVNEDFLWILESLGVTEGLRIIKEESKKEAKGFLQKIIEAIRNDLKASAEITPTQEENSKEALQPLPAQVL